MTCYLTNMLYNSKYKRGELLTIYLDVIFLENLLMNYIIIYACKTIIKEKTKQIRIIIASTIGSIYAVSLYIFNMQIYSNLILKLILSVVMVYISFAPKSINKLLKQLLIFYLTSFTFGGVAFSMLYILSTKSIIKNGVLIGKYPIKTIIASGFIGFIIITAAFKNIKGKLTKKDLICEIKIKINSKEVFTKCVIDTGNFLKDPISKTPVIVVEKKILEGVIEEKLLNNLNKIIKGENVELGNSAAKIRLIPFSSLGKQNGMLIGIKAEEVLVNTEEKDILIDNIIIGIYDGILSKAENYSALIGIEALENSKELLIK